jgi:hypothetical protein
MLKARFACLALATLILLLFVPVLNAESPSAPLPSQILTARKVFISNAGGLLDLNIVSGDPKRDYNQFYAAMQTWGHYSLVGSPAEADLVVQISIIYIPRLNFTEPFPSFRVALLDPKSNVTFWVLDEFLVDKPTFSMILKKNRDKVFDEAIEKLVSDLKALTAVPGDPVK